MFMPYGPLLYGVALRNGCAPNFSETQKESKWPKSDSKLTPADQPQSDLKIDSKVARVPIFWRCPEYGYAFPEWNPEQIRKHPGNALRANPEFPGFVRLEIPKPWKLQEIPSPD